MLRHVFLVWLALTATAAAAAPERNPVPVHATAQPAVERVIIRFRAGAARMQAQSLSPASASAAASSTAEQIAALGARAGVLIAHSHSISGDIHVARLMRALEAAELESTLSRLRADATVLYAEPDRRKQAHGLSGPDDPLYLSTPGVVGSGQWYMQAPQPVATTPATTTTAAVNATGAWGITTGTSGVVIADLDTGVRFDHPDLMKAALGGKLLPGFDFVGCDGGAGVNCPAGSTYLSANDGDGWDADPSDPGDWISTADLKLTFFSGCTQGDSSWHGTRTAGILGALTNNGVGIAGMSWGSWVLPVRVLGKCGGYDSDIIAGMLWAAGIAVPGAPANPDPARVINMSLGSANACSSDYQDAIAQVNGQGTIVVASAGNEGGPVDEPANCPGAVAVVGVRHVGSKVGYSSLGSNAALAAPAGNCVNASGACLFSIETTVNLGKYDASLMQYTTPGINSYTDQTNFNVGTSFSAPIVSGISALMLSVNGNLSPAQLRARLQRAARTFPANLTDTSQPPPYPALPVCAVPADFNDTSQAIECTCTTGTCGAGLADAQGSVNEALRPIAALAAPATVSAGQSVALSAAGSAAACGQTVASYAWSITGNPNGTSLTANTGPTTSLSAAPASGTVTVQLVVTDSAGLTDTATIVIGASTATTSAPANAGSSACLAAVSAPAPTATLTVAPTTIGLGQMATLNWSSTNSISCSASGAWTGNEMLSGTQTVTPSSAGSQSYTLTCTGAGGSSNASATLTVNGVATPPPSGGGGGALDPATLALGALLGLAARRRRPGAATA